MHLYTFTKAADSIRIVGNRKELNLRIQDMRGKYCDRVIDSLQHTGMATCTACELTICPVNEMEFQETPFID
jgi:hypothetical protein